MQIHEDVHNSLLDSVHFIYVVILVVHGLAFDYQFRKATVDYLGLKLC